MEVSEESHLIIADLLRERTGQQLDESRRWRVASALGNVFRAHGISNIDQLVCLLDQPRRRAMDPDLATEVVEALLNNETYFFRDKPSFDQLPATILPALARRRARERRLSIWCAGCSTGQEAYSLAMLFENQPERWAGWSIEILGTDISHRAIRTAQDGRYTQFEVQRGLGVAQMLSYFDERPDGWQIREPMRKLTRFRQHHVLRGPPTRRKHDLILCRNVLLYFDEPTRRRAFEQISASLASDGFLMLGAGETIVSHTRKFDPVASCPSVFGETRSGADIRMAMAS